MQNKRSRDKEERIADDVAASATIGQLLMLGYKRLQAKKQAREKTEKPLAVENQGPSLDQGDNNDASSNQL